MRLLVKYGIVFIMSVIILACNKVELDSINIICNMSSDDMIGTFYTANGETLRFSIALDKEKSTAGLSMQQIEVFMNNIKIAEVYNKETVDVNYVLKNKTIGKNPLRITLKATAPDYRETTVHLNMNINVLENKPLYGFELLSDSLWNSGSTASISIKEIETATLNLIVNSVSYLIDEKVIGTASGTDSNTTYDVKDITPGDHLLYALINCTTPDNQLTTIISVSKQITVQ